MREVLHITSWCVTKGNDFSLHHSHACLTRRAITSGTSASICSACRVLESDVGLTAEYHQLLQVIRMKLNTVRGESVNNYKQTACGGGGAIFRRAAAASPDRWAEPVIGNYWCSGLWNMKCVVYEGAEASIKYPKCVTISQVQQYLSANCWLEVKSVDNRAIMWWENSGLVVRSYPLMNSKWNYSL